MKKSVKLLSLLMVVCLLLSSCAQGAIGIADANKDAASAPTDPAPQTPSGSQVENLSSGTLLGEKPEKGSYNEGVVLVKCDDAAELGKLGFVSTEPLYAGSSWHYCTLAEGVDTAETVEALRANATVQGVDYDYVMGVTADVANAEVSGNPNYESQKNHGVHKIPEGWEEVKKNGKHPGGSPDVVVAVIDTGVDYNHLDLRNNIWVNPAEIPNNGKDDDGNGYVDDIYGWDCVGNDNDPMDDNGHGTHVAGIIAAENNKIGGVGVAYNCKVMVLKAGNSSGYFNNSDIAEAIQYAYMNGASVINMSFGGSNISIAVEEALENAYNSCVLVAAAGNDGACNNFACEECDKVGVSYPAALPYVIGVMSTNGNGSGISGFSNFDHYPHNSVEYEVFAVGEAVPSCWPGNKYATLNGTSMAAPTVAGIAALLRSAYTDREVYSTKFIQSQIVNTGTINPYNATLGTTDSAHSVANVYEALTQIPKPEVNLYDYSINDSTSISANNNGNGVIDAGETVRLSIALQNRGGIATNVNVSIDTNRGEGLTDPYFTFVNSTMQLSDIGMYSVRESGNEKYFEIIVSPDCPNDYLVNFNIRFTYENGLDTEDKTVYEDNGKQKAQFNVSRGFYLPRSILEDTTYTADRIYIVTVAVYVPSDVTVTFEEGCQIQFYDGNNCIETPCITVKGTLVFEGSKEHNITIFPSERYSTSSCNIYVDNILQMNYVRANNLDINGFNGNVYINNSFLITPHYLRIDEMNNSFLMHTTSEYGAEIFATEKFENNFVYFSSRGTAGPIKMDDAKNNIICCGKDANYNSSLSFWGGMNNLVYSVDDKNTNTIASISVFSSDLSTFSFSEIYQKFPQLAFGGYYDTYGNPTVDVYGSLADASMLWPYIVNIEMFDKDGNPITTVGREEIKVRVTFNRPMDVNAGTFLTFGTIEPYGDYRIDGEYISDTVWEGTYTLKAQIENGQNFLKVNNAWAAEDPTKTVFGEYQLHEFTIDTTAAMSMNLQAVAKENGIELTFVQDDYDTLLGYNIYRSTEKDGNFVKLNPAILLPTDSTFLDENAEPGKTYWYTYTVVLTDFTESNPAGKVVATAMDTLAPNMYHTPVNQGYMNNNLVISCTASDNVAIASVVLYYRTVGATEWKSLTMGKQSDKYSATVFGSDLTMDGLEYYIVAYDEYNSIAKGSAETPYTVVIKDASAISRIGDVDGDGVVTAKDALMLMRCLEGSLLLSDDEFRRADLNGDGKLSAAEALRILQYVNGKVNTLEM